MSKLKKEEDEKIRYGTVSLPMPLINKIQKRISGTGMPSVSAYVSFVLRSILPSEETKKTNKKKILFSKKDKEDLKSRLKHLGYE